MTSAPLPNPTPTRNPPQSSSWWRARFSAAIDNHLEWRRRVATAVRGRTTARLEIVLPRLEVELARQALERNGWQALSVGNESPGESHEGRALILGTKRLRSTLLGADGSREARHIKEVLSDACVQHVDSIAITTAGSNLANIERWVPARRESRDRDGWTVLGTEAAARRAWQRVSGRTGPGTDLERVRTLGERVLGPARAVNSEPSAGSPALVVFGLAALLFTVALVWAMVRTHSEVTDQSSLRPPWWQLPELRNWLLVLGTVSVACGLTAWVERQRLARAHHPGNDKEDVRAFVAKARTPLVWSGSTPDLSTLGAVAFVGSMLSGAPAMGIFLGGVTNVPRPDLASLLAGPALCILAYALWAALSRLRVPLVLQAATTLGLGSLAVFGYGKWRLYVYFAGMGVSAGTVDIPQIDALTVAGRPLAAAALCLILGWATARWLDNHARVFAGIVFLMFAAGAIGIALNGLSTAERRGRSIAIGLGPSATPGLQLTPGPTPKCLVWASPDAGIGDRKLPREVWAIGRDNGRTLVLDPEEAQRIHRTADSSAATYVPDTNVVAPIRPLGDDQVRLLPKPALACGTAYPPRP